MAFPINSVETARLLLRVPELADAEALMGILWDPEVVEPGQWPGVDLGWVLQRSRWGHGFATEAATAALRWAWECTQIDRIVSLIAPDDLRSIRIATKIGERFERADVDPVHGEPMHVYSVART